MTVAPRQTLLLLVMLLCPALAAGDPPLPKGADTPEGIKKRPRNKKARGRLITLKVRPSRRGSRVISWIRRPVRPGPAGHSLGPSHTVGWGGGETLTYAVKVAGVHAGRAAISVGHPRTSEGRSVLKLRGLGETVPFISTFARMREEVVTEVNLTGMLPLRTTTDRKTGKPGKDRWMDTRFGPLLEQRIKRRGRQLQRKRRIQGVLHDPISALFALRSLRLRPGHRYRLLVLNGNSLYETKLKVVGRKRIYTRHGPRNAIRVDGIARRIHDDGRPIPGKPLRTLSIWLSADRARVPLRLRGDTKLGSIEADITSHRPTRSRLRVRVALAR